MTKQREDNGKWGTPFGHWLRNQPRLDSSEGYVATDIDYLWSNYRTGEWMLIEEKCRMAYPSATQKELLLRLRKVCQKDPLFRGLHLLQFECETPDDGQMFWNKHPISTENLIAMLRFGL
jgi:hypothetical protein